MKTENHINKVLLAVDGSDQALGAVHYVSRIFPCDRTEVVLFHVENDIPDLLLDMNKLPLIGNKISDLSLNGRHKDRRRFMSEFMEKSVAIFRSEGYPAEFIHQKVRKKHHGISRDIIEESSKGYGALVVGRSGLSRLKDIMIGSTPIRLIDKVRKIALIIVGGRPLAKKLLVCVDGSEQSVLAVRFVGNLLGSSGCRVELCHVIKSLDSFKVGSDRLYLPEQEQTWQHLNQSIIEPAMKEAHRHLVEFGFVPDHVVSRIMPREISRSGAIIKEARSGGFESIVVGRRGLNVVEEIVLGRVSKKVLEAAGKIAVWMVFE